MSKRISKKKQQKIGRRRIRALFSFAEQQAKSGKISFANNAVRVARKIAMKTTSPLPKIYKHQLCKHCHHYLYPSVTCRVRIKNGKKTITCFHCKKTTRYPYKP